AFDLHNINIDSYTIDPMYLDGSFYPGGVTPAYNDPIYSTYTLFANLYTQMPITFRKVFLNPDSPTRTFTFDLTLLDSSDGSNSNLNPTLMPVSADTSHNIKYNNQATNVSTNFSVPFTLGGLGTWVVKIHEEPNQTSGTDKWDGWTNDSSTLYVRYEVTPTSIVEYWWNGSSWVLSFGASNDGTTYTPDATADVNTSTFRRFCNDYDPPLKASARIDISATKKLDLNGGVPSPGQQFTFNLEEVTDATGNTPAASGYTDTVTTAGSVTGTLFTFAPINFVPGEGTVVAGQEYYYYKITESPDGIGPDWTRDTHSYVLTVLVTFDPSYAYVIAINGQSLNGVAYDPTSDIVFTNSYNGNQKTTFYTVTKQWVDGNNASSSRPTSVVLTLLQDGVPYGLPAIVSGTGNSWDYTFNDLPKYSPVDSSHLYTYSAQETFENIPVGYTMTQDGNVITNTLGTSLMVTKQWADNSNAYGTRPTNITVTLLQDGVTYGDPVIVTGSGNTWYHTFTGLPKYSPIDQHRYVYSAKEDAVDGYSMSGGYDAPTDSYIITNTLTTGAIPLSVTKQWDDSSNAYGLRPSTVTLTLLQDGMPYGLPATFSGVGDSWNYTFSSLPKYSDIDQHLFTYTVREDLANIPSNYTMTQSGNTITNKLNTGDISIPVIKKITGDGAQDRTFSFDCTQVHNLACGPLDASDLALTPDHFGPLSITTSGGTGTGMFSFTGVPAGDYYFKVTETGAAPSGWTYDAGYYAVQVKVQTGTVQYLYQYVADPLLTDSEIAGSITFTNTYKKIPPSNTPTIEKTVGASRAAEDQDLHPITDPYPVTTNSSGQFMYEATITMNPSGSTSSGGAQYATVQISDKLESALQVDIISVMSSKNTNSLANYDLLAGVTSPRSNIPGGTLTFDPATNTITYLMDASKGFPFTDYDGTTITLYITAHIDPNADLSSYQKSSDGNPLIPNTSTLDFNGDTSSSNTVYVEGFPGKGFFKFGAEKTFDGMNNAQMYAGEFKFAVVDMNPDSSTYMKVISIGYNPASINNNYLPVNFDGKAEFTKVGTYKYAVVELGFSSDNTSIEVGSDFTMADIKTPEPHDGYGFSEPRYVFVYVTGGSNGILTMSSTVSASLDTVIRVDDKDGVPTFYNTYGPYCNIHVTKIVKGAGAPDTPFEFTLTQTDPTGTPYLPLTSTSKTKQIDTEGAGSYNFQLYDGKNFGGVGYSFYVVVKETSGSDAGWTYDSTRYLFKESIAQDGTPTITYTKMPDSGPLPDESTWAAYPYDPESSEGISGVSDISFTNTYESEGFVLPAAGGFGSKPFIIMATALSALLALLAGGALIYRRRKRRGWLAA
ncbi:MAG: Cna B-type domain-containing protein, partial [Coriobacteriia bacterium]|nr:Cna B-type domain-containing protein [Coriobacteriia bacterium]